MCKHGVSFVSGVFLCVSLLLLLPFVLAGCCVGSAEVNARRRARAAAAELLELAPETDRRETDGHARARLFGESIINGRRSFSRMRAIKSSAPERAPPQTKRSRVRVSSCFFHWRMCVCVCVFFLNVHASSLIIT